ncbi:hypothetical protein CYLTODRAFT_412684 [Cylindrobasidium torrendii FP15055 ss-10]|uniref:Uncharacterized protein n=1 Tax=Cylindrobasidium torrendii FP15055 ss-10 TaxID=1314674 RepID=A0A0D7B704_9AGAR|nr:hypothetical protein CYLTODRAFT_412684 [Cylindrobasidium torrendii FP15055 ss-10]
MTCSPQTHSSENFESRSGCFPRKILAQLAAQYLFSDCYPPRQPLTSASRPHRTFSLSWSTHINYSGYGQGRTRKRLAEYPSTTKVVEIFVVAQQGCPSPSRLRAGWKQYQLSKELRAQALAGQYMDISSRSITTGMDVQSPGGSPNAAREVGTPPPSSLRGAVYGSGRFLITLATWLGTTRSAEGVRVSEGFVYYVALFDFELDHPTGTNAVVILMNAYIGVTGSFDGVGQGCKMLSSSSRDGPTGY